MPGLKRQQIKHYISKIKADIKLCTNSFSVLTLLFSALSRSSSRGRCMVFDNWIPSHSTSDEEMFPMMQEVECILWLAELKFYTCIWCKFNWVYLNQTAAIYRSMMPCGKSLEDERSTLWQQLYGAPCHFSSCVCAFWRGSFLFITQQWRDPFPGAIVLQLWLLWTFSSGGL